MEMNREQFKGQWKQFKGELKKQWGKFTDDDLMRIEGDYDKFIGSLQERYGEQKEEVRRWVDRWYEQQSAKPGSMPKAG
jgi:uncharacterized protein YjbJ (UPF0337 family)